MVSKVEKWMFLVFVVVVFFSFAGSVSAAVKHDLVFDDSGPDHLWDTLANWKTDKELTIPATSLPTSDDVAFLEVTNTICEIDATVNAVCGHLVVAEWYSGNNVDNPVSLNISGGTLDVVAGGYSPANGGPTTGNFDVGMWSIKDSGGGAGIVTMTAGTVDIDNQFDIGMEGYGEFRMYGGTVTAAGTLWIPGGFTWDVAKGQEGHLYLYGGTVRAAGLGRSVTADPENTDIDIRGGTLILDSNSTENYPFNEWLANGWIKAYGGDPRAVLSVVYDTPAVDNVTITATMDYASVPSPADTEIDVVVAPTLTWNAGDGVTTHDVYFGTDYDNVNNATTGSSEYKGPKTVGDESYVPGTLILNETYYWRIDEVGGSTYKGVVWSFTVTAIDTRKATNPDPADEAGGISLTPTLSWTVGIYAESQDVYFGTSYSAVDTATTGSPEFKVNQPASDPNFAPGELDELDLNTDYFWRIDSVDSVNTYKGHVWTFETRWCNLLDDFESYVTDVNLTDVWAPSGTATVTLATDPNYGYAENPYDYDEGQSMKIAYDNNPGAATYTYSVADDWNIQGISALVVRAHGELTNDVNDLEMYMNVKDDDGDNKDVVYPTPADLVQVDFGRWLQWNIDLQDFTAGGSNVDLFKIKELTIGFRNLSVAGSGVVYIDNVILCATRCVPEYGPTADLDGDCQVGIGDLVMLVGDWLKIDGTISAATPDAGRLQVHYEFNETSGNIAYDSSVHGRNATGTNITNDVWDVGGKNGGCINLDGIDFFRAAPEIFASVNDQVTVAMWVNATAEKRAWEALTHAYVHPDKDRSIHINFTTYGQILLGAGTGNNAWIELWCPEQYYTSLDPDDYVGSWNHFAFTKDGPIGRIYINGVLISESYEMDTPVDGSQINQVGIGAAWTGYSGSSKLVDVKMDDYKVYDYALSQPEILTLAEVSSVYQESLSPADLHDNDKIDLMDLAVMGQGWLDEQLFP